ncbi:methyltransferase domain-containing protein [Candidatus Falkowbacteria bacterium]|nr:methyltransferase domain-containing protein [Candidatus Falkowbacteria bacterium]
MQKNKLTQYQEMADKIVKDNVDHEREEFEDRNVLERIIFPNVLAAYEPQSVLDIGREDYQQFYNEFFEGRELWTMDRRPTRVEFGAEHHISADVVTLKKHFKNNYFDLIIMNGVFGWGLNDPKKIEKTFAAIHDILKPGGVFIFGYNDWPNKPMEIEAIENLKKLKPLYFEPLKGEKFKCVNGEHTYRFFIKN